MGSIWLEHNLQEFLAHTFGLASNPKAAPSHVDAVYARKCVLFILHALIGGILGDKSQITAAKEICQVIIKQMTLVGMCTLFVYFMCIHTHTHNM